MSKSSTPPIGGSSSSLNGAGISSKDKRYYQQIEKVLTSFDSIEEWADYIAFLSKLQKTLQLNELKSSTLPFSSQISYKLALCLSSKLPNGVHQKTLSMYDSLFTSLSNSALDSQINIWLPGLLPLISYCSIQIKPLIVQLFQNHIIGRLSPKTLKLVTKPLILAFLPGLDDENSETFSDFLSLMDNLKKKSGDDKHFWQSFFLCMINNPERRLGGLFWCNKRLPVFTGIKRDESETITFSDEAQACISPEPGLLIRAFASAITSATSMIEANDVIVVRGFFDLLLTHLPLDSAVIRNVAIKKDKELLLDACCSVTLKKDMSLNRRLWNWLLGPETDSSGDISSATTNASTTITATSKLTRSEYFTEYSLPSLSNILLEKISNNPNHSVDQYLSAFKISLSLILDKWEISRVITPVLFLPIMRATFHGYELKQDQQLLITAQSFFDSVEAIFIWNDITRLIIEGKELDLVEFVVNNFDINEDEMKDTYIPLAIVSLVENLDITGDRWLNILETLLQGILLADANIEETETEKIKSSSIFSFYEKQLIDPSTSSPFSSSQLSSLILSALRDLVIKNFDNHVHPHASKIVELYCKLTNRETNHVLIDKLLSQPITTKFSSLGESKNNLLTAYNVVKLLKLVNTSVTTLQRDKLLKIIMSNLYYSLTSPIPSNCQVETVKAIFLLDNYYLKFKIEASILKLFISTESYIDRVRAFSTLWSHSSNQYNEVDSILLRPLFLILDGLAGGEVGGIRVANFVSSNVLQGGSSNRLLKLITTPLLGFDFIAKGEGEIGGGLLQEGDDLGQFSYHISTIVYIIETDEKHLKENFNNELVVMDSANKLNVISNNSWDISTYKTLMVNIIEKFLGLKISDELLQNSNLMMKYYQSVTECLKLYSLLVSGIESDFISKFHGLIEKCSYIVDINSGNIYIELAIEKYLECISFFLKLSETQHVNLDLLHIDDEGKTPQLIRFITEGIKKAQTVVLLEKWTNFLTRSLYLFNESVFLVLLTLNDVLVYRIDQFFTQIKKSTSQVDGYTVSSLNDVEGSINVLFAGLEDLLSISHSYLLSSSVRARELNGGSGENTGGGANGSAPGFFGNVIQGVFLIESPAIRTTEENRKYSILLAFQDAVAIGYKIWLWAESATNLSSTNSTATSTNLSSSTSIYLSRKLKFKARKLLESVIELERQEIIESLISLTGSTNSKAIIKLLHVLDGGRSQVTLPNVYNSIMSRLYPAGVDEKLSSSLNSNVSAKELARFLLNYIDSIDDDTISDIWSFTLQFFKEVNSHPTNFKSILPDLLKTATKLMSKLSNTKFGEQGRSKKDLSDIFMKLLMISVRGEVTEKEKAKQKETENSNGVGTTSTNLPADREGTPIPQERAIATQSELLDTLQLILTKLNDILSDSDKVSSCINTILVNLVSPQIKNKKIHEIPNQTIGLIALIGNNFPNKAWKAAVLDCFMDNSFFSMTRSSIQQWELIIQIWIANDRDRIFELISKITPISTSTAANIFNWNESSEIENKIFNLKRIIYFILIQPKDYFLNNLEELINRVELTSPIVGGYGGGDAICPPLYKSEVLLLLRVISLKFNDLHLLSHWTMISCEILSNFNELVEQKNAKELLHLTPQELKVVLFNSKLLDQLLILKYDEFNLNEWLYVTSSPEVVTDSTITHDSVGNGQKNGNDSILSVIDRISREKDFSSSKESAIKVYSIVDEQDNEYTKPLLEGIKRIESISSLRLFFDSLSLLHYERTYGLKKVDYDACEQDILNDVVGNV